MWRNLHCWWECKLVQPLWRTIWTVLNKLKVELAHDPTLIWKDTCTPMFTSALFTIAKTWKQPKYPLTYVWIKICCIYIYMCAYIYMYVYIHIWSESESHSVVSDSLQTHGLYQFSSVQLFSHVRLFVTPWIAALQASLSITNSRSLFKLMSIELVMPSSHLTLYHPILLLPPIPPSIRVFSNESALHIRWPKY